MHNNKTGLGGWWNSRDAKTTGAWTKHKCLTIHSTVVFRNQVTTLEDVSPKLKLEWLWEVKEYVSIAVERRARIGATYELLNFDQKKNTINKERNGD